MRVRVMKILQQAARQYPRTRFKIVIVTGLSDPNSCRLTEAQLSLINLPALPPDSVVTENFPFVQQPEGSMSSRSLAQASLANGLQFFRTWTAGYRNLAAVHWASLLQSVDHLLVVAGSCGIQLVTSCPAIQQAADKVRLLALGPVGTRQPRLSTVLVQGQRDWLSRSFFPRPDLIVARVGHLDYWENSLVRELVDQWLRDRISEFSEPAAIFPRGR
jgi:hypothetical protein